MQILIFSYALDEEKKGEFAYAFDALTRYGGRMCKFPLNLKGNWMRNIFLGMQKRDDLWREEAKEQGEGDFWGDRVDM